MKWLARMHLNLLPLIILFLYCIKIRLLAVIFNNQVKNRFKPDCFYMYL
ncbi:MAG: hypothetical protein ACTS8Y_00875 [Arsenophonus sp. ER-EMS1-MAG3]